MAQGSVPSRFWEYVFQTTVYLINKLPTPVLGRVSPHYMVHRSFVPPIRFFVFSGVCDISFFIPITVTRWITDLPHVCSWGCRCMDINTNKIFVCRHVHFDKAIFPLARKSVLQPHAMLVAAPWVFTTLPSYSNADDVCRAGHPVSVALAAIWRKTRLIIVPPQTGRCIDLQPAAHTHGMVHDLGTPSFFLKIEMVQTQNGLLLLRRCYMGDNFDAI